MEALLEAIASPRRRAILRLVWDAERSSSDIAAHFDAAWPSISRSLRDLREAGAVRERRVGTQRLYRADREALAPLETFLTQLWEDGLDRVGALVREEERAARPGKRGRA